MNADTGHGHVTPRKDGVKARCGGPALCSVCQREKAALGRGERQQREDATFSTVLRDEVQS